MKRPTDELIAFLDKDFSKLHVVVMPDFFHDRLITLQLSAQRFSEQISDIVSRKGGSIDGVGQMDLRGGNAINTASALAALGAKVTPIVCTSPLGLEQIRFHLKHLQVDTSHIKTTAKASITTALEFETGNGKANVMLRDLGSLVDFGPKELTETDYLAIEDADYVCLFNWAGTRKHGTELAQAVFGKAKAKGRCKTYFDTADPTPNSQKIPQLIEQVLETSNVDILSLNENEAFTYASAFAPELLEKRSRTPFNDLALESARVLAKHFPARIDLHTTSFSATVTENTETIMPTFNVQTLRATGAGDAWNAGNILADGEALSTECRLTLANAISAFYLSDNEGVHPTPRKLQAFLKKAGTLNL